MTTRNWYAGATTAAALIAVPVLATADGTARRHNVLPPPSTAAYVPGQRTIVVNEDFKRPVAEGCHYVGTLRGEVAEFSSRRFLGGARYNPNLTLRGQLICPDGTRQSLGTQTISGNRYHGGALERAIESTGRVTIQHAGRVCTVTPDVGWHRGQIVVDDTFSQSCSMARGGGPLAPGGFYIGR
jgi:hypothetical protein